MFNLEKEIIVETNALDYTIRVYISQKDNNRKLRPIAFYLRKMNPIELNYKIHNKELLAIVEALKKQQVYLEGFKYLMQIYIDYKNLIHFIITK